VVKIFKGGLHLPREQESLQAYETAFAKIKEKETASADR